MATPLATLGVISIGEMGLGIAKLLKANGYRVVTNISGRRHVLLHAFRLIIQSDMRTQSSHTCSSGISIARPGIVG